MFSDARFHPYALVTCPLLLMREAAFRDKPQTKPNQTMKIVRRIGPHPHANGRQSAAASGCPDILELADGDFAIIGIDITDQARGVLPADAGCGPDERIIRVPRATLQLAKPEIPA